MMDPVRRGDRLNIKRVHAFETTDIIAEQTRIRPAAVMGINPACVAEKMLAGLCPELIATQMVLPFDDPEIAFGHRPDHSSAPAAKRTIAAFGIDNPVRQIDLQLDGSAMAGQAVFFLYQEMPDLF
jgi:hypothetical protein